MQRYFAKGKKEEEFILYDSDYHHIKNVMRSQIGDKIEVVYDHIAYICKMVHISPLKLEVIETKEEDKESNIDLVMAVSLVNEQKFDLIIQKLTELGVSTIIPIKTDRSIVKLDDKRSEKKITRWQTICKEASEQSKRTSIPKITNIMTLKELTSIDKKLKLICSLSPNTLPLEKYLKSEEKELLFVIGPEGGFTKEEETYLLTNEYKPVSLGKRVMRVETAALYVASIINYVYRG